MFTGVAVTYSHVSLSISLFLDSLFHIPQERRGFLIFYSSQSVCKEIILIPISESIYSKK